MTANTSAPAQYETFWSKSAWGRVNIRRIDTREQNHPDVVLCDQGFLLKHLMAHRGPIRLLWDHIHLGVLLKSEALIYVEAG